MKTEHYWLCRNLDLSIAQERLENGTDQIRTLLKDQEGSESLEQIYPISPGNPQAYYVEESILIGLRRLLHYAVQAGLIQIEPHRLDYHGESKTSSISTTAAKRSGASAPIIFLTDPDA